MTTRLRFDPSPSCDVLVAGGGPAGAAVAAALARAGLRVTLLDRQRFPRDKVCGDFVGPSALVELEALGVQAHPGYGRSNIINQAAVHLDGRELIRRPLPEVEGLPPYGRTIPRMVLDEWLLDAAKGAGANVLEGYRVTGYQIDELGVNVTAEHEKKSYTFRSSLLIGADGSNSVVSRVLRGSGPPDENRIIAVRAYYEGDLGPEDRADLYFSADSFPGYYWLFPTGEGRANVGVGMVLQTLPPTEEHLRELLLELVKNDHSLGERLEGARIEGKVLGWPLNTYDPRLPVVGDRVILVGDAAGFINPLNGEGIQYALLSARWAAETTLECVALGDYSAARLRDYATRAERELRYDMALAGMIVQLIRNRHLTPVWLEALKVISTRARFDKEYAEITGGILAGLTPAREAFSLKVISGTVDQAVYSLGLSVGWSLLQGQGRLGEQTSAALRAGAAIGAEALRNPLAFAEWALGVLKQGGELASQAGLHLLDRREAPRPELVAPALSPARLKIPFDHVHDDLLDQATVV